MKKTQRPKNNPGSISDDHYLLIDTTPDLSVRFGCADEKKIMLQTTKKITRENRSNVLKLFVAFLKIARIRGSQIQGVFVVGGSGSFTAVRTGIAIAQTYAMVNNIPIAGVSEDVWHDHVQFIKKLRLGTVIKPKYGRPPSITRPRRAAKRLRRSDRP
jgi:hypothetical protein